MTGVNIQIDPAALEPLIRAIVAEVVAALGNGGGPPLGPAARPGPLEPLLVTPADAARLLGVCERTLWGMDIPRVRLRDGGETRYAVADLHAWIDERKRRPPAPRPARGAARRNVVPAADGAD